MVGQHDLSVAAALVSICANASSAARQAPAAPLLPQQRQVHQSTAQDPPAAAERGGRAVVVVHVPGSVSVREVEMTRCGGEPGRANTLTEADGQMHHRRSGMSAVASFSLFTRALPIRMPLSNLLAKPSRVLPSDILSYPIRQRWAVVSVVPKIVLFFG